jgi:hypothetical protein
VSNSFDTARVAVLQARTVLAVAELRGLRCADIAAAEALTVIKLAIHTLEQWWLPTLGTLLSADESIT